MRNFLTLIFIALLLFLIAELGFYLYLLKTDKNQKSITQNNRLIKTNQTKQYRLEKIEGKINLWQDIPDSVDKYLILSNNNNIYKARVIFDKEAATSPAKIATGLGRKRKDSDEFDILGPIANYSFDEIKRLGENKPVIIKPVYLEPKAVNYLKDENNIMIANWFIYSD
jgi:hypothetical protein